MSKRNLRSRVSKRFDTYDRLESKQLLAGDVGVYLENSRLVVWGDQADNQVEVRVVGGQLEVSGKSGTTINGQATPFRTTNYRGSLDSLWMGLGNGNDTAFVEGVTINRSAFAQGGQGADNIGFYKVKVVDELMALTASGDDTVSLDEVEVGGNLRVYTREGNDTIGLDRVEVRGHTLIAGQVGNDRLSIRNSTHLGGAGLFLDRGDDFLSVQGTEIRGFTSVAMASGSDDVFLENLTVRGTVAAFGGIGNDRLELSGTNSFSSTPSVFGFEGNDVAGGRLQADGVFNSLITSGARLGTIVELAVLNPNFSTLVGALQTTGLVPTLSGAGPFTVFAPTNAAFSKISGTVASLTQQQLTNVLLFHVVNGAVSSSQLVARTSVDTLLGQSFSVNASGGNVVLNGNATLAATDIRAKNGIIHVLNDVLVPVL